MEFKITLYCRCCGQKLDTFPYYAYGSDFSVVNVQPCKKGCSEADMLRKIEEIKKERIRIASLPKIAIFGDHLRATR